MKIYKVVYNDCYGGFSLSRKAVLRAREISGDPKWGGPCIDGDTYEDGKEVGNDYGYVDIPRHDPILVRVVEELGEKADGMCASLAVRHIESNQYRIEEYDGFETVITPNTYHDYTTIEGN